MNVLRRILTSLCLLCAVAAWHDAAGQSASSNAPAAPKAVSASMVFDNTTHDVDLVGREKDTLFYRPEGGPAGASTTLKVGAVASAEFKLQFDGEAAAKALMEENWPQAAIILLPVVTPLLPYLDINENNGVDVAMDAGKALMKSARNLMRAGGAANMERGTNIYLRAYQVFKAVGTAVWSPEALSARLRAVQCLTAVNDLKTAARELDALDEPEVGDSVFGLYWLAQAQLRYAKGQTREAMNAAVQSLVFDNKTVETFPDALFMTARCYEDMLEWYRARDVYYEIARLFPRTENSNTAREKLKTIMDKGLTKAKETSPIEAVFFGLDEDVNAKATALLGGAEAKLDESTDEDIDRDVAAETAAAATNKQTRAEGAEPK